MSGCYGTHPEDRAMEAQLHRYLDENSKQDVRDEQIRDEVDSVLMDEAKFQTLNDDYEIVTKHNQEIMRMLRNLDDACKGKQYAIDAITIALRYMQDSLIDAVKHDIGE